MNGKEKMGHAKHRLKNRAYLPEIFNTGYKMKC